MLSAWQRSTRSRPSPRPSSSSFKKRRAGDHRPSHYRSHLSFPEGRRRRLAPRPAGGTDRRQPSQKARELDLRPEVKTGATARTRHAWRTPASDWPCGRGGHPAPGRSPGHGAAEVVTRRRGGHAARSAPGDRRQRASRSPCRNEQARGPARVPVGGSINLRRIEGTTRRASWPPGPGLGQNAARATTPRWATVSRSDRPQWASLGAIRSYPNERGGWPAQPVQPEPRGSGGPGQ